MRKVIAAESGCGEYERMYKVANQNGAAHCEHGASGGNCDDVPGCVDVD